MSVPKISILVNFPISFQKQFDQLKKQGVPVSEYIRRCVREDKTQPESIKIIIQEAIKSNLPGFCGGFISSIMLNKLLKGIPRTEQRAAIIELGYSPSVRLINPVLPDQGCPRLYIHQDADARHLTKRPEIAKQYTRANHHGTQPATIARIKKFIREGRPGFVGGFISLPHIDPSVNIHKVCSELGYHPHPTEPTILVRNGTTDDRIERFNETLTSSVALPIIRT